MGYTQEAALHAINHNALSSAVQQFSIHLTVQFPRPAPDCINQFFQFSTTNKHAEIMLHRFNITKMLSSSGGSKVPEECCL